jgi:hypothetical protein
MRDLIKKILKEEQEEDDGFNWADLSINSPRQILDNMEVGTEWIAYIPEISRQIEFSVNPESDQPMARIRVRGVDSEGSGRYGDNAHKYYQPSPIDELNFGRANWVPDVEPIGKDERGKDLYDVVEATKDMKSYSDGARQLTLEYKQKIQEITSQYAESLKSLHTNSNFSVQKDGEPVWGKTVSLGTIDSSGKVWTDEMFDEINGGFRNYPGDEEIHKQKRGENYPPRI